MKIDWKKMHMKRSAEEKARIEAELKKAFQPRKPNPFWSKGDGRGWKALIKYLKDGKPE